MIVKHVSMRSLGRSDFADLVNYITDAQSKDHRLGQVRCTNCSALSVRAAIEEVLATQQLNTRARGDKTYHLIVSFRVGEQPDAATLEAIEQRICVCLGFGEHQRISALHLDTDNLHLHLAINKIHPRRYRMHEPFGAYRTLAELCQVMERDYQLQPDNHEPHQRLSQARAADMERHTGQQSLLSWIRSQCLEPLREAQSWSDLHQVLRDHGLQLRERGNGLVIEAEDGTRVKASSVERSLSKAQLEQRHGPFQPDSESTGPLTESRRHYLKQPLVLGVDTVELYARYRAEQQQLTASRADALSRARRHKERALQDCRRAGQLRRAAIRVLDTRGVGKPLLYAQAHAALQTSLKAIHQDYRQERRRLYQQFQRRSWADWLRLEALGGNAEALACLRARQAASSVQGNTLHAEQPGRMTSAEVAGQAVPALIVDGLTKKGTLIYRAGASAVRDAGEHLQVSREASREAVQLALRLALARYGERICVQGSAEFKAQIVRAAVDARLPVVLTDPGLERRRLAILDKETIHEPQIPTERARIDSERRPADRPGAGRAGVGPGHSVGPGAGPGLCGGEQSHARRPGHCPPPAGQHRLRTLSELGLVRFASGAQVLLPRDVPRQLEQPGAEPDHALRRAIPGTVVSSQAIEAVQRYIAERESKRARGLDIRPHRPYLPGPGLLSFAGLRHVDGCDLALVQRAEAIEVMPVDPDSARRLARLSLGAALTTTASGSIRTTKARTR